MREGSGPRSLRPVSLTLLATRTPNRFNLPGTPKRGVTRKNHTLCFSGAASLRSLLLAIVTWLQSTVPMLCFRPARESSVQTSRAILSHTRVTTALSMHPACQCIRPREFPGIGEKRKGALRARRGGMSRTRCGRVCVFRNVSPQRVSGRALHDGARALAKLHGPHVAHILDVSRAENGTAYMVLEYLAGQDLHDFVEDLRFIVAAILGAWDSTRRDDPAASSWCSPGASTTSFTEQVRATTTAARRKLRQRRFQRPLGAPTWPGYCVAR